jgi:alcohol dehydrogenase class IV/choline kinase
MGYLTKDKPKAFLKLSTGESLLNRQLRLLRLNGITEVIISTGPFHDFFSQEVFNIQGMNITLVNNEMYSSTNSIYSLFKALQFIQNDSFILLHGDLVFDPIILKKLIDHPSSNVALINKHIALPEKDFKGRINGTILKEISVSIFDQDCYALQPMYKFSEITMKSWLVEVKKFINLNNVNVYAEIPLNNILPTITVDTLDYENHLLGEIDNIVDLNEINQKLLGFEYPLQQIVESNDIYERLEKILIKINARNVFFVSSKVFTKNEAFSLFVRKFNGYVFSEYSPNPTEEDALKATHLFKQNTFDAIVAIGGGSVIDIAKGIKLLLQHEPYDVNYNYDFSAIPLIAIPSTAGTGSESTRFAVIYQQGIKKSLTHDCLMPDFVILSDQLLNSVPDYIKRSSLLDALCQAIESIWAVGASTQSIVFATEAINLIITNYLEYLRGDHLKNKLILKASNLAGKAINISKTTGPHALSYNLTTKYNLAHGHAVSLLLPNILKLSLEKFTMNSSASLIKEFNERIHHLNCLFNASNNIELVNNITQVINNILDKKIKINSNDLPSFVNNINLERMQNHPIPLTKDDIEKIYRTLL